MAHGTLTSKPPSHLRALALNKNIARIKQRPVKLAGALTHLSIPDFIQRVTQPKHESIASVLPISVTVEDHTVYDETQTNEKSQPLLHDSLDKDTTPAYPPGLSPLPAAHARDARRHAPALITPPPTHSFDAPSSIWTSTMGSIA